jgi:hypothetical protein
MKYSDVHRVEGYDAKYVAQTVALKVAARLDSMKSSFTGPTTSLFAMEQAVKAILDLDPAPIQTIQYPFYLCFARKLWALDYNGIGGAAATAAAQQYKTLWTTRGLESATLIAIALNVFGITVV